MWGIFRIILQLLIGSGNTRIMELSFVFLPATEARPIRWVSVLEFYSIKGMVKLCVDSAGPIYILKA